MDKVADALTITKDNPRAMLNSTFKELVGKEATATSARRSIGNSRLLSAATARRIRKELDAKTTSHAGTTTLARTREDADPRNMYTEAIILEAFQKDLPTSHVINLDASQYDCG
jgi:hypothetical protein